MKRVLVAMSGGVDSSVAALLLQRQGYECVGVTMRLQDTLIAKGARPEPLNHDAEDARRICDQLGMEFHAVDFSHTFEKEVVEKFVEYYENGWTPNPCVECNRELKFGRLLQAADDYGCEYLATGHYAQVIKNENGIYQLQRASNIKKDQSYVLFNLNQSILSRLLFPIGTMESKDAVRAYAEKEGLITAQKTDSQDICFIPDGDYVRFIERYEGKAAEPGEFMDAEGHVIGKHMGAIRYTIGQRRGIGIPASEPLYVTGKNMETNQVFIGKKADLYATGLLARDWNWIGAPAKGPFRACVKVRYNAKEAPCTVTPLPMENRRGREVISVRVDFDEPQRAVAPGQAAVAYQGNQVLGGGTIIQVG
ncbi:tRNA 2-thiouridine(34) synthase MnmA [Peptoniphilaceae bacterium SGI.137]